MSRNNDDYKRNKPSMYGTSIPFDVDPNDINRDVGDEVTRRACTFQPNFATLPSFQPLINDEVHHQINFEPNKPTPTKPKVALSTPTEGKWRLDHAATLPDFYPLERTAVFVPHVADPSEITLRISDVLRDRSIDASYHNEKAKAVCTTMEGVEFRIRLYSGRGEYSHGIIVEVQRRFGTSNSFHDHVMAILDAAEGKESAANKNNVAANATSNIPFVEDESESTLECTSSLDMISKMFNNPTPDTQFLALQTLSSLTDASKIGQKTAQKVSNELFRHDSDNVAGAKVLSLIIDKKDDGEDRFKLRTLALNITANAFEAVGGKYGIMLKEQLRQALISELRSAEKNPRNAVYAARIIKFFVPEDNGSDMISALELANNVGVLRNAQLEKCTQVCLNKFE